MDKTFFTASSPGEQAAPLSGVLESVFTGQLGGRLSANQRAAKIWYGANGDVERAHTTGVFLKKAPRSELPVLCVYVDSHSRLTDFHVSRELYLARLANQGLYVSNIEFLLTRRPHEQMQPAKETQLNQDTQDADPLPAALPEDTERAERLCSTLPESLRNSAMRAVELSLRRQRAHDTGSQTNTAI